MHKHGERRFVIVVFPKLSIPTRDFTRVDEGKNGCLLFVCNVGLIFLKLQMEEDGIAIMVELHLKEHKKLLF
jgi:hypothetical protein